MGKKPQSIGTCRLCEKQFARTSMTSHLKGCLARKTSGVPLKVEQVASSSQFFHLVVEERYDKMYWMHLAVPITFSLQGLDRFLRTRWLECCGHLSSFKIGSEFYESPGCEGDGRSMNARLGRILEVGMSFGYEYDFGTTTELTLKVIALREQSGAGGSIELLATNDSPQTPCQRCGQRLATKICTDCGWMGEGWLCDECAGEHECGDEMFLPVLNSPRTGVCGYGA